MQTPPTPPPPYLYAPILTEPEPVPSRGPIVLGVIATLIVAATSLAVLIYHAVASPEPSRVLIIRADRGWQNVQLTVEGGALSQPTTVSIDKLGNYIVPFFLWPGKYTLHVRNQGTEVYSKQFDLVNERSQELDLIAAGATTQPATAPATRSIPVTL
ncbi:MAG TPA: hypothetical protein VHD56_16925 [Tepidisphaeraceae bacterium]|nr:hypothetical protein [Tepidisphaeraceae bacterium]